MPWSMVTISKCREKIKHLNTKLNVCVVCMHKETSSSCHVSVSCITKFCTSFLIVPFLFYIRTDSCSKLSCTPKSNFILNTTWKVNSYHFSLCKEAIWAFFNLDSLLHNCLERKLIPVSSFAGAQMFVNIWVLSSFLPEKKRLNTRIFINWFNIVLTSSL